ncbi:quinone-dependent dihydroorotate dehydrogenase [Mesohalobacter halotolerans]|uniref:Dihydroorotate dehydrogenase (quinone) n=1 Tax=Mesohalobacter halotolerans TaxID=1883405 RepID=A0A4U5TPQ3_9FLAO|nr:quinone-dependent dihydroorotate dehydrogenase [Mesohalobacter halotolerans]MBS3738634.1 quinone-dependent dihydroorotate dehydrogenase [Psychroflexus sp.]TKS56130.1 quinone-dependent dihydroorotate dehydrogenase [Mesohalobacter halotolerans]
MYKWFIRPLLFSFDPEKVHYFTTGLLKLILNTPLLSTLYKKHYQYESKKLHVKVCDILFKNPVGLAAGFDKNAEFYQEMSALGFGFIEIGTVTPKPQPGNPKKRLFRLKKDKALINRMGFNNNGVEAAVEALKHKGDIIIGGNIGKNKMTPNNKAVEDYKICFKALFDVVDYFVVNVSSPNTPDLRALQDKKPLLNILNCLQKINLSKAKPKPILLKIAPDLNDNQLFDILDIVEESQISGIIATNTTISRDNLKSKHQSEIGGLSGQPLKQRSTEVIQFLKANAKSDFPIIGVGGIHSASDAVEKFENGASLVQLYTGFVYEGPKLVKDIKKAYVNHHA